MFAVDRQYRRRFCLFFCRFVEKGGYYTASTLCRKGLVLRFFARCRIERIFGGFDKTLMLTIIARLCYNVVMDEQEKNTDININVPAPVADTPNSDELMIVSDGDLPTDTVGSSAPAESTSVTMYEEDQLGDSMRGGYASVKGNEVKRDNRLVWIVILVMTVMCLAVGICSSVITARLVQKGNKPPIINTNGEVQQNIAAVVTARKSNIVEVRCGGLTSSGIVMKRDGRSVIVLTNAHAIAAYVGNSISNNNPRVRFEGYDDYFVADVKGYDSRYDVAVLDVTVEDELAVYDIDGSDVVSPDVTFAEGDRVVSIGNAMSLGIASYEGIISRKSELLECDELFGVDGKKTVPVFRTTAVINAGMSGGGVFDMNGRLIGLGTYRMSNTNGVNYEEGTVDVENTGFATPMSIVYPVYKRILAGDGGAVGLFTVNTEKTTSAIGMMGLPMLNATCEYKRGKLTVKSAGDGSKLHVGDVITKIGDYTVTTDICEATGAFLRYHRSGSGKALTVTVSRGGSPVKVTFDEYSYAI